MIEISLAARILIHPAKLLISGNEFRYAKESLQAIGKPLSKVKLGIANHDAEGVF